MDVRQQVNDQLRVLSQGTGHSFALDEDGVCGFVLDEERDAFIVVPEGSDAVTFCVGVVPVFTPRREAFFARLLSMNYADDKTMGAALCLNDDQDEVVLRHTLPAERVASLDLGQVVGGLGAMAKALAEDLTARQRDLDGDGDGDGEAEFPPEDDTPAAALSIRFV